MCRRLKILVSAYACSPIRGSEPGMGWGFVRALAKYHDLWVIVEKEEFQNEILENLEKFPEIANHVKFFFVEKKRHRILRKIWPPSYYWFYKAWQIKAFELAKDLCEQIDFDLVHQLNMVGYREPGYLWRLHKPFVWGPIGGFVQMPIKFLLTLGYYGFIFYLGRNILNWIHARFLIRPRMAAKKAGSGLIAATSDTALLVKKNWGHECHVISEIGLPEEFTKTFAKRENNAPLRLVWSADHSPRKALPILLRALSIIKNRVSWKLDILGEGRETAKWHKLSHRLGIDEHCTWHGWVTREKVLRVMREGHVMVVTSLIDLTSTVIVEAISQGLPVICLDHCGFSDVITEECGIKIPVTTPGQVIENMSKAIMSLANDEAKRRKMAQAALKRAEDFEWDKKILHLNKIYEQVLLESNS